MHRFIHSINKRRYKGETYEPYFSLLINNEEYFIYLHKVIANGTFYKFKQLLFLLPYLLEEKLYSLEEILDMKYGKVTRLAYEKLPLVVCMDDDLNLELTKEEVNMLISFFLKNKITVKKNYFKSEEFNSSVEEEYIGNILSIPIFTDEIKVNKAFMTLEGYNEKSLNLYLNYVGMKDFKELHNHLNLESLPNKCTCGGEVIVRFNPLTDSYSSVECVNPFCCVKYSNVLAEFIASIGVKGLGVTSVQTAVTQQYLRLIYSKNGVMPMLEYLFDESRMTCNMGDANSSTYREFIQTLKSEKRMYTELIPAISLPNIGELVATNFSKSKLDSSNSYDDIYNSLLGTSIKSLDTKFNIFLYLEDLKFITSICETIDTEEMRIVNICVTGSLFYKDEQGNEKRLPSREFFVKHLNEAYAERGVKQRFKLQSSVTRSTDLLIYEEGTSHSKLNTARSLEGVTGIKIMTLMEFFGQPENINEDIKEDIEESNEEV